MFHEATYLAGLGGRLDTDALAAKQSTLFAQVRHSGGVFTEVRHLGDVFATVVRRICPKLPPVHVDFVANSIVGAWAFSYKGQYFIGITKGAVVGVYMLFERMLSDRRILRNVGDPNTGVDHPPLESDFMSALVQSVAKNGPPPLTDPIRREYCSWLIDAAFMFLVIPPPFPNRLIVVEGMLDAWPYSQRQGVDCWKSG